MKKTCKYFAQLDEGGNMVLGDCVRDRCESYDKDNACCVELTQGKALEKLASCVYVKNEEARIRLEQVE